MENARTYDAAMVRALRWTAALIEDYNGLPVKYLNVLPTLGHIQPKVQVEVEGYEELALWAHVLGLPVIEEQGTLPGSTLAYVELPGPDFDLRARFTRRATDAEMADR